MTADKVGMIVVDGVRYRPEEAKALELEPTEPTPVVDPYAEASAQAKAQAEADAAELEDLRALALDPERLQAKLDEHAKATQEEADKAAAGAVTTAAAQPANKARTARSKSGA